jgi:hypothetical protein
MHFVERRPVIQPPRRGDFGDRGGRGQLYRNLGAL